MAFHEQHERECPACGARISATAPKCLNCGRFVDEDDEDDSSDSAGGNRLIVLLVIGVLAVGVGLAVFFLS